jgi:hypothetical protein
MQVASLQNATSASGLFGSVPDAGGFVAPDVRGGRDDVADVHAEADRAVADAVVGIRELVVA